jgi:hypothetical protein
MQKASRKAAYLPENNKSKQQNRYITETMKEIHFQCSVKQPFARTKETYGKLASYLNNEQCNRE